MFTDVLSEDARGLLALLGESRLLEHAYLAGGTALALRLGHRRSFDFDFFTPEKFDEKGLEKQLKELRPYMPEQAEKGTVLGKFGETKFSIFVYDYPVLFPTQELFGIKVLDKRDIAAMKIAAIAHRGTKRDFVDMYFLCKEGLTLEECISLYDQKFSVLASNYYHIKKSLTYFKDAETDDMPEMIKQVSWQHIKNFFLTQTPRLS